MPVPLRDLSRLCIHTITTRPWTIEEAVPRYAAAGVKGVTVWREALAGSDTVHGAMYYFNPRICNPSWSIGAKVVANIGQHRFVIP